MNKDYFKQATRDLKKDPKMRAVIAEVGEVLPLRPVKDPFQKLSRSIVGQQLSVKAAASIYYRLLDEIADGKKLLPLDVIDASHEELRNVGLSNSKSQYLRNLAEYVINGNVTARKFTRKTNEEVIEELTAIKGIGRWTVEMYLMFGLGRTDVLPVDDLGIQKGFMKAYGLRKLPTDARMWKLAENWNSHYTVGCIYLWRSLDNE